jgi:hypothetical protein
MGDPPPPGKHEMCHPFHAQQKWRVHTTPFISLIVFCFDLTSTSHTSTRGRNPHPGQLLLEIKANQPSRYAPVSLAPDIVFLFFPFSFDFLLLT